MSKFIMVCALSLVGFTSTRAFAQDQIFMMKNYAAKLELASGQVVIDSEGFKLLKLPLMTFNDQVNGKHTRIWPPRSGCSPQIQVTQKGENTLINIRYDKSGLVKNFEKTILLMPDSISIETSLIPVRTFYSCSSGIELLREPFDGSDYTGINKKKSVSGTLPQGIATKSQFVWNGLNRISEIAFTKTKVGTVSFDFGKKKSPGPFRF